MDLLQTWPTNAKYGLICQKNYLKKSFDNEPNGCN